MYMTCHPVFFLHPRSPMDKGYEPFFHISIVEGDISLVLDNEALSRYKLNTLFYLSVSTPAVIGQFCRLNFP